MSVDKMLQAQCLHLIENYEGVIDTLIEQIEKEASEARINGETSFSYAKAVIHKQGISDGLRSFKAKLLRHASKQ